MSCSQTTAAILNSILQARWLTRISAAYYHWINQQRLPGSEHSSFLVWFEGHNQALVIAPYFPKGKESDSAIDLGELLSFAAV